MAEPVSRAVVEGFYKALASRDMQALASYLDEDVTWTMSGPIDVLPFCGRRSGKTNVLTVLDRDIPSLLGNRRLVPRTMLVDGDRAAVVGQLLGSRRVDGHPISCRIAQFIRFRDEKVVDYISIIDSFDAVEQVLGHPLERKAAPACVGDAGFVAV
ncbi:MAG: nuclear transport factor 2 family protein [Stellaceae bacterium]